MSISAVSIPVHDNVALLSYSVSVWEKEIRFRTDSLDGEPHEYTDMVFSDVIVYHFERDNFFRDDREYAWPVVCEPKEGLLRRMHEEDVRAFGVQSSYGLSGRVWARSVTRTGTVRR